MNHIPVSSSIIKSVAYDADNQKLEIKFHGGAFTYEYAPVSKHEYIAFLASSSKGAYYHKNIKHRLVTS